MAFQLNQTGIPATYALVGGTKAWHDAGYPMEGEAKSGVAPPAGLQPAPQTPHSEPHADDKKAGSENNK